jgi:hypothetical protein
MLFGKLKLREWPHLSQMFQPCRKEIFLGRVAPNIAARCNLRATCKGCEPTDHDKSEKARSIEAIESTMQYEQSLPGCF